MKQFLVHHIYSAPHIAQLSVRAYAYSTHQDIAECGEKSWSYRVNEDFDPTVPNVIDQEALNLSRSL